MNGCFMQPSPPAANGRTETVREPASVCRFPVTSLSCCMTASLFIPKKGAIILDMGINKTAFADALFSGLQRRVLGLLFGQPDRSFFGNELQRLTNAGRGALQRELEKLVSAELVTVTPIGNQKHYQANPSSPIFLNYGELCLSPWAWLTCCVRRSLMLLAVSGLRLCTVPSPKAPIRQ